VGAAKNLADRLRRVPGVAEVSLAGSVRRRCEIIRDIDCVVSSAKPEKVLEAIRRWPDLGNPNLVAGGKVCGQWEGGIPVEIHVVSESAYPFALLYGTGSSEHRDALARHASLNGFSLTDRGLTRSGKKLSCRREQENYAALAPPAKPFEKMLNPILL